MSATTVTTPRIKKRRREQVNEGTDRKAKKSRTSHTVQREESSPFYVHYSDTFQVMPQAPICLRANPAVRDLITRLGAWRISKLPMRRSSSILLATTATRSELKSTPDNPYGSTLPLKTTKTTKTTSDLKRRVAFRCYRRSRTKGTATMRLMQCLAWRLMNITLLAIHQAAILENDW